MNSVKVAFHQISVKENHRENTNTLLFAISLLIVVIEEDLFKIVLLEPVSIRFFAIVTGQGF